MFKRSYVTPLQNVVRGTPCQRRQESMSFFSIIIRSVKRSPCLKAILIHFSMNYIGDEVPSSLLILAIFFFPYFVCTWRDRTQWCCGVTVLKLMQLNHVRGEEASILL